MPYREKPLKKKTGYIAKRRIFGFSQPTATKSTRSSPATFSASCLRAMDPDYSKGAGDRRGCIQGELRINFPTSTLLHLEHNIFLDTFESNCIHSHIVHAKSSCFANVYMTHGPFVVGQSSAVKQQEKKRVRDFDFEEEREQERPGTPVPWSQHPRGPPRLTGKAYSCDVPDASRCPSPEVSDVHTVVNVAAL